MIDLLKIAKTEADGGDLQQIFDDIYEKSDMANNIKKNKDN